MTLPAYLLGIINRGSLAYMLLESPLLVSHRPAQECSQTGTWTKCGYNPPAGRQRTEQLDLCLAYELCPCRESVYFSPFCLLASQCCCCFCCKGISSTVSYHRDTLGDCRTASMSKWKGCTQPVCHAATLTHQTHTHTGWSTYTLSLVLRPH